MSERGVPVTMLSFGGSNHLIGSDLWSGTFCPQESLDSAARVSGERQQAVSDDQSAGIDEWIARDSVLVFEPSTPRTAAATRSRTRSYSSPSTADELREAIITPSPSCQADADYGETLDLAGAPRRSRCADRRRLTASRAQGPRG
jgi:hypothetical protein